MNINDAFPSKYLKADDLQGKRLTVQIASIAEEDVGQTKERKLVLHFTGKTKGLVLNKTNATTVADICGSTETDHWINRQIVIYPDRTPYQGKLVPCIRISDPPKASAPAPTRQAPPLRPTPPPPVQVQPFTDDKLPDDFDESSVPF